MTQADLDAIVTDVVLFVNPSRGNGKIASCMGNGDTHNSLQATPVVAMLEVQMAQLTHLNNKTKMVSAKTEDYYY